MGQVSGKPVLLSSGLWFHPGVAVPQKPFSIAHIPPHMGDGALATQDLDDVANKY